MQFQIEIINVQATTKPTKKGSYIMLDVAFKNLASGKVEGKKIMSFTNKEVFAALQNATNGSVFDVTSEKNNESGYWDWVNVTASTTASPQTAAKSFTSPKSTYETADERAARQVLIVRQSCLAQAVATLAATTGKDKISVDDVLKMAETYTTWVFQKDAPLSDFTDMADDVPY